MNQPWVSLRYLAWSGSSICTRERTKCLRPVICCTKAVVAMGCKVGRGSLMKTRLFCSISMMSAYLATDQNGSKPSGAKRSKGAWRRNQRNCS